nr:prp4-like protein [Cryptomonas sp.]
MYFQTSFFFVVKILKTYGHPVILFSDNMQKIKIRFKCLVKFHCARSLSNKIPIFYKKKNIDQKFYLNSLFFVSYKNEIRKKKYETNINTLRYVFSQKSIQNSSRFILNNNDFELFYIGNKKFFKKRKILIIKEENIMTSCSFLKENQEIGLGFSSGDIKIFDLNKKKYTVCMKGSGEKISFLSSHPYSKSIIISTEKNLSRIWSFYSNAKKIQILSIFHDYTVVSACFRTDGKSIDFANCEKTIKCFDIENQKWLSRNTFDNYIFCISNDKNGKALAVGKKGEAGIFDHRIDKEVIKMCSNKESILGIAWIEECYLVIGAGISGLISLWDLRATKERRIIKHSHGIINFVKPLSNLKFFITSGNNKKALLWNLQNQEEIHSLSGHKKKITSADLSDETNWLCTGGLDMRLVIQCV